MEQPELVVGHAVVHRRHLRRAGLLVATALVVAACGGSSHKVLPTTTSGAPTSLAAPGEPTTSATGSGGPTTTGTAAGPGAPTTSAPAPAGAGSQGGPPIGPAGDAFYTPPSPLPGRQPGDLIWYRPFTVQGGAQGYLVLYRSLSVAGAPIAVSGVVIVPGPGAPSAPPEGRPVMAWAHGTTGLGDSCAPSKSYPTGKATELIIGTTVARQGFVYAATDYEGLGTPGVHPYLVGQSEGRGVLDSVRAARQIPGSGATATSKVIVWGHSQGGGAAMFAGELAKSYAADLDLVGVIAGAPAAELTSINSFGGPYEGFGLMAAAGFHAAYPDLALGDVLTPAGVQAAQSITDECSDQILRDFANKPADQLQKAAPMAVPAWAQRFTENDPGGAAPAAPVFIYQGEADEIIPVAVSAALEQKLCALGATSFRKTYPGATHVSSILAALGDIQSWMTDRLAGKPAPTSC